MPSVMRLGPYELVALIGSGAMGEVYRARDARLGRDVAVKVLPRALMGDAERLARFEREAKVLAALNHPNIATIHGIEEGAGLRGLVMELVDGETLAERCAGKSHGGRAPAIRAALAIAGQIAAALEAAHQHGIVHRDLKPENVMINAGGVVKVLDFGLAKIREAGAGIGPAVTIAADGTREGAMLGTTAYMSPEQARGFGVDQSADVWAFGCVLYELLTGKRAFEGPTDSDTIAAVLEHEPDWTQLPAAAQGPLRRLLQRCLAKDPRQRLRDIGAVRILVEDALAGLDAGASGTGLELATARVQRVRVAAAVAATAILALALGALAAYRWAQPPETGEPVRVALTAPGPISPQLSGLISPDGRHVAFVATGPSGQTRLWVRTLDSLEPRELQGTERAAHPFWSPDSLSIGFVADAKVKRVDLAGGPVQTLADANPAYRSGAAWSPSGIIVFGPQTGELATVPAAGGPTTTLLKADPSKGEIGFTWPDFLPDGRHFLYYAQSTQPEHNGVFVGSLDSSETKRVLENDVRAKYAAPGYLLYLRDDTLLAQPFDTERLALDGEPTVIAGGVWFARGARHASFSASRTGTLAYVNFDSLDRQLVWFDRDGRRIGSVGPPFRDILGTAPLSPDGRRIVIGRGEVQFGDLWVLDVERETLSRVTFDTVPSGPAVWGADGRRLLLRAGADIVVRDVDDGSEETLLEAPFADYFAIAEWSRDERYLVLSEGTDLWVVDLLGDRRPVRFLETPVNEMQAQLAPNGRWIAYTSNETGRDEVYVQSFPVPGRKRQISVDGGAMPRWRRDGGELFFLSVGQILTAVPVRDPEALELGPPEPLFRAPLVVQGSESFGLPTTYDVAADGKRFLLAQQPPENPEPPLIVVLNWWGALPR